MQHRIGCTGLNHMLAIEIDGPLRQGLLQILAPPYFTLQRLIIITVGSLQIPAIGALVLGDGQSGVRFGQQFLEAAGVVVKDPADTADIF